MTGICRIRDRGSFALALLFLSGATAEERPFSPKECSSAFVPETIFKSNFDCTHYLLPALKSPDGGGPNDAHNTDVEAKRYERDVFVGWLMQQVSYGNVSVAKDMLPEFINVTEFEPGEEKVKLLAQKRFRWLVMEDARINDSGAQVLSCTLRSIQHDLDGDQEIELGVFGSYVDAETENVADLVEFWMSYDLVVNQAQTVLAATRADLLESGALPLDEAGRDALSADLDDGRCAMVPMLNRAEARVDPLDLPQEHERMIDDAADLARNLWKAVDHELGFELELASSEGPAGVPERLADAVNRQLHCETLGRDDPVCHGIFGAIDSAILKPARELGRAFADLEGSIDQSAQAINLLNADLMKVDRNLRTYTEVFADFDLPKMNAQSTAAEAALRAILEQREFVDSGGGDLWEKFGTTAEFLRIDRNSELYRSCVSGLCGYCEIAEPLSAQNLEQYLACFHIQGVEEARQAYEVVKSGSIAAVGENALFHEGCDRQGVMSNSPPEMDPDALRDARDDAITECFIDWVWQYDPAAGLSFEASIEAEAPE